MKQLLLFMSLFFIAGNLSAQKSTANSFAAVDKKALLLPDSLTKSTESMAAYFKTNFTTDHDRSRAIFIWLATNISYDLENMFAINFYEKKEDKIRKALQTRKGICENYALLFNDLCSKTGIKSYVIEGYTKQNGFTSFIPHAWCAAMIDTTWLMFDPTWGSGYVDDRKFYKKINNYYFQATPVTLIKSHIPFDYLWQFLNYPVTSQEFKDGKTQIDKTKPFFNYVDSIKIHESLNHIDQVKAEVYRIEKNGANSSLIFERLQRLKIEIENDRQNKIVNLYNSAVADFNESVNSFNDFVNYRNKQFTPKKTDPEIRAMLDVADNKIKSALSKLGEIENPGESIRNSMSQLSKSIAEVKVRIDEQQSWLTTYFSKNKSGRKAMFYDKVTWFGIPLN